MSVADEQALVQRAPDELPVPIYGGVQMVQALAKYRELQTALDKAMPDQIQQIGPRQHRKKGYWRAVSVAFGLQVEPISEERLETGEFADGRANFTYNVTYRATAPSGRTITGDGSCSAVEKAGKFKCPHPEVRNGRPTGRTEHYPGEKCPDYDPDYRWERLPENATEHNVRSHAHTRAFNRAVSNLCGFGEVSAEEVDRTEAEPEPTVEAEAVHASRPVSQREQPAPPGPRDEQVRQAASGEPPHPADQGGTPPLFETELPPAGERTRSAPGQPRQTQAPPAQRTPTRHTGPVISEAQDRRLYAIAMQSGWNANDLKEALEEVYGFKRTDEVTRDVYNDVIAWIEQGPEAAAGERGPY